MPILKYRFLGKEEHYLAGVRELIKPGVPFEVTPAVAAGLERCGRDSYEPVVDTEESVAPLESATPEQVVPVDDSPTVPDAVVPPKKRKA